MEKVMFYTRLNLMYLLISSVLMLNPNPIKYMAILFVLIFVAEVIQGIFNHIKNFKE
jgi:hypothetical protein